MTIKKDRQPFLSRWSRLKQEAREVPERREPAKPEDTKPAAELPPVDQLNHDSDFQLFMDKRVDDRLRRLALKKLFTDPQFNLTDGLDDYAEDYTLLEDLPEGMAELQQHARRVLRGPESGEKPAPEETAEAQPQAADQVTLRSTEQSDDRADGESKTEIPGEKREGQA